MDTNFNFIGLDKEIKPGIGTKDKKPNCKAHPKL